MRNEEPKGHPTWVDKALIIAVYTFVIWALFFLPAKADSPSGEIWLEVCKGGICDEIRLPLDRPPTPYQCMMWGQEKAAEYMRTRPEHRLTKIRCGKPTLSL